MTVTPFAYIVPVLTLSMAAVLVCFYLQANKTRASFNIPPMTRQDGAASGVCSVSLEGDQTGVGHFDRLPPRYCDVDPPPPYSLFDPRLTSVWPGGPPPAYGLYPMMLPLAPHHWGDSRSDPRVLRQQS